jgi:hypothetical protein
LGEAAEGFQQAKRCHILIVAQAPGNPAALPDGVLHHRFGQF